MFFVILIILVIFISFVVAFSDNFNNVHKNNDIASQLGKAMLEKDMIDSMFKD